jgi:hypothetical protein
VQITMQGAKVRITPQSILISLGAGSIKIGTPSIELTLSDAKGAGGLTLKTASPAVSVPSTIVIDSKSVQITMQGAKVRITPQSILISLGAGSIKIGTPSIELKHGSASAALQQFKVSLNKGALEVM